MLIAAERYLAVCHDFKHGYFTKSKIVAVFCLIYIAGIICNIVSALQVLRYKGFMGIKHPFVHSPFNTCNLTSSDESVKPILLLAAGADPEIY